MITRIYMKIFTRNGRRKKNMKPLWKVQSFFDRTSWTVSDVQIVRYTWVLVARDKSNHPVADFLRSVPQES